VGKAVHFCLVSKLRMRRDILTISHCLRGAQMDNFYASLDDTKSAVYTRPSETFSYTGYVEYNVGR
jgi:hypothetical protein